jgi:DNA polymerase elongation subunit (family B)
MYGALASDQFSMQSRGLASLIAALGREGIKETIADCERRGLKVLYADTDSVSVCIEYEKAEQLGRELTKHLQEYFKARYRLPIIRSEIRLKLSKYARSIIFLGKKNYALWDGNTVEIVGLFRQARSHFAQRFQEELYGMVLKGDPLTDVKSLVEKSLVKFRHSPLEEVALHTQINQPLDKYKVASWHIRGARNSDSLLGIKFDVGDTIKLVWLKDKKTDIIGFEYEDQVAEYEGQIDWERMEDSIRSLAKPVMEIMGKGEKTKQKTLF